MRSTQWNKQAGPRPTKALLDEASKLARVDTADHVVVAMALRPNGVTQQEVITMFGKPHRNKIRQLLSDGKVKQLVLPEGGRSTRIKLDLKR